MNPVTPEMENTLAEWCGKQQYWKVSPSVMPALLAQIAKEGWRWQMGTYIQDPSMTWVWVHRDYRTDPDPEVALKLATYAALEARNA